MPLKTLSLLFPATLSLLFVGMSASAAHAYLDGGTGSMILQVLLGGVAGLAIAGKLYWYKFLSVIGVKREVRAEADEERSSARSEVRADQ